MKRLGRILCAGVLCMSAMVTSAQAEGFTIFEWSSRGNALSGAVVARADDPSAVAFNPAGITQLVGKHFQTGISTVTPTTEIETEQGGKTTTTKNKSNTWLVPNAYYTQQVNDNVWFGMGLYSRFGLGIEYPSDWAGRNNIIEAHLETVSATPVIAYKINEQWSVAAGIELMYARLNLKKGMPVPVAGSTFSVEGDSVGVGGLAAVHYKPNEQWAVGLSYKSQVRQKFEGDADLKTVGGATVFSGRSAHGTMILPDEVLFGVVYKPTDRLSIETGFVWTNWSSFQSLNLHFGDSVKSDKKDWHDSMRYNIGVEYALTDAVDLRAGYIFDESPVRDEYSDYMVPTNDRHLLSAGVGYTYGDWTFDVSYMYIMVDTRYYDVTDRGDNATGGVLTGESKDGNAHIFGLSVGYTF